MSLAPKLIVIDGGLSEDRPVPTIPPATEAERLHLPASPSGGANFAHVVAVSLVMHAAILAGSLVWNIFGEERAAGGSEELVVIEGVNVVLLDQMQSAPSPLSQASAIETPDATTPVAEAQVAAVEPEAPIAPTPDMVETPSDIPDATPPEEAMQAKALRPVETPPDEASPVVPETLAALPSETPQESPEASKVTAEAPDHVAAIAPEAAPVAPAASAPSTATESIKPADPEMLAATQEDIRQASGEETRSVPETAAAFRPSEDEPAVSPDTATVAEADPVEPIKSAPEAVEKPVPAEDAIKSSAQETRPVEDDVRKPAAEVATAAPLEEKLKPVEDKKAVAATEPEPPKPAKKPAKPVAEKKKPAEKPKAASAAKPSAAASEANPTARGAAKGKAGAGGKTAKAQGKANLSNYKSRAAAHVRRFISYPSAARAKRLTGVAVVSVTVGGGGRVVGASLAKGTGQPILDKQALAIVRKASPFPPLPAGAGSSVVLRIPIRFAMPN